jgi:hypothetical protein
MDVIQIHLNRLFVGPCPHMDWDYHIGSNFWKFYFTKTDFTLDELVSLVKVFTPFKSKLFFFDV